MCFSSGQSEPLYLVNDNTELFGYIVSEWSNDDNVNFPDNRNLVPRVNHELDYFLAG